MVRGHTFCRVGVTIDRSGSVLAVHRKKLVDLHLQFRLQIIVDCCVGRRAVRPRHHRTGLSLGRVGPAVRLRAAAASASKRVDSSETRGASLGAWDGLPHRILWAGAMAVKGDASECCEGKQQEHANNETTVRAATGRAGFCGGRHRRRSRGVAGSARPRARAKRREIGVVRPRWGLCWVAGHECAVRLVVGVGVADQPDDADPAAIRIAIPLWHVAARRRLRVAAANVRAVHNLDVHGAVGGVADKGKVVRFGGAHVVGELGAVRRAGRVTKRLAKRPGARRRPAVDVPRIGNLGAWVVHEEDWIGRAVGAHVVRRGAVPAVERLQVDEPRPIGHLARARRSFDAARGRMGWCSGRRGRCGRWRRWRSGRRGWGRRRWCRWRGAAPTRAGAHGDDRGVVRSRRALGGITRRKGAGRWIGSIGVTQQVHHPLPPTRSRAVRVAGPDKRH
eukprot:m.257516 g.257516  ORF g.257516 m.257516 type:complete len:449 (-) comp26594_c0_seq1:660-2006(-)